MNKRIYNPKEIKEFSKDKQCGIYQIRNKINGNVYIGSSKQLKVRKKTHFKKLEKGEHDNIRLQRAFDKYGEKELVFEIIEFCEENERFQLEQYWIDSFIGEGCYNINPSAVNPPDCTGMKRHFSEEHNKNLSIAMKKRFQDPKVLEACRLAKIGKNMGKDHVNSIPVVCLETREEFAGESEAERITGCSSKEISCCCRGKRKTVKGLHWVFKSDYVKMTKEDIERALLSTKCGKTVVCLETRKVYKKAVDAMKDTGSDRNNIIDCCNGLMIESRGLHWAYYDDFLNMTQKDIDKKLQSHTSSRRRCLCVETQQVFESIAEAAKQLNVCQSKITLVCRGDRKTTGGYHFEYVS